MKSVSAESFLALHRQRAPTPTNASRPFHARESSSWMPRAIRGFYATNSSSGSEGCLYNVRHIITLMMWQWFTFPRLVQFELICANLGLCAPTGLPLAAPSHRHRRSLTLLGRRRPAENRHDVLRAQDL
jgi:hypothetical protein